MSASSSLLLVLACAGLWSQALGSSTATGRLRIVKEILEHDRRIRPDGDKVNLSRPLMVTIHFSLDSIGDLDASKGVLQVTGMVGYRWKDSRMAAAFETDCNSSFAYIHVPVDSNDGIWTPDIELHNAAAPGIVNLNRKQEAAVSADGTIMWYRHVSLSVTCQASRSPFNCTLKFGSWVHNAFDLDLAVDRREVDLAEFISSNRRWVLNGTPTIERKDKTYACCPENFPYVEVTIPLKRRRGGNNNPTLAFTQLSNLLSAGNMPRGLS